MYYNTSTFASDSALATTPWPWPWVLCPWLHHWTKMYALKSRRKSGPSVRIYSL